MQKRFLALCYFIRMNQVKDLCLLALWILWRNSFEGFLKFWCQRRLIMVNTMFCFSSNLYLNDDNLAQKSKKFSATFLSFILLFSATSGTNVICVSNATQLDTFSGWLQAANILDISKTFCICVKGSWAGYEEPFLLCIVAFLRSESF